MDRAMLTRITAALDADPFADPVRILGTYLTRASARKIERELTAKFSAVPSDGRKVVALHNAGDGHTSPASVLLASLPEGARAPFREALSGSLFNPVHG